MWCPSCIFFYDDIMDMRADFAFQHVTEYLVQNLDKLDPPAPARDYRLSPLPHRTPAV